MNDVRWGFLGAGWLATEATAAAAHAASGAVLEAVAARDPVRAAALEPRRVLESYRTVVDDPDVVSKSWPGFWAVREQMLRAGR